MFFRMKLPVAAATFALTCAGGALAEGDQVLEETSTTEIQQTEIERTEIEALDETDDMDEGMPFVDADMDTDDGVDVSVDVDQPTFMEDLQEDFIVDQGDRLPSMVGTILQVGGGVANFTTPEPASFTSPAGTWNVRGIVGSRSIVAGEIAYVGAAQAIDAVGLNSDAALLMNGAEAALRLNAPIPVGEMMIIEPFAFGGVGAQFWNLVNEGVNTSSIGDGDVTMTTPLGAGLAIGFENLIVDGRFAYRPSFGNELFGETFSAMDDAALNTWSLAGNVGFEF